MQRYLQWSRSCQRRLILPNSRRALAAWQWSKKPNAGTHDPKNLDPHIAGAHARGRAVPACATPAAAIDLAADVSRTTQQSPIVLDLCRLWAALLIDALSGARGNAELDVRAADLAMRHACDRLRKELDDRLLLTRCVPLAEDGCGALSRDCSALCSFATTQRNFVTGLLRALRR